eukprot:324518-Prymnesium_polylepis.1
MLTLHRLRRDYDGWPGSWDGRWFEGWEGGLNEGTIIDMWKEVADEFCGEWNLFAADIMNEPYSGSWASTTAEHSEWEASGHPSDYKWEPWEVDWQLGAARLGNAVLERCPRLLIFVEGTAEYDGEWGQSFHSLLKRGLMKQPGPVTLTNRSKLILSPHTYGPSLYAPAELNQWMPARFKEQAFPKN